MAESTIWQDEMKRVSSRLCRRVPLASRNYGASPAAVEALSNYKGENYPFRVELDVQFSDLDCFKHVNNARYFTYFETARCKVWEEVGLPLLTSPCEDTRSSAEVGPVLAATSCVFKRQVSWPDRLCVGMRRCRRHQRRCAPDSDPFQYVSSLCAICSAVPMRWRSMCPPRLRN